MREKLAWRSPCSLPKRRRSRACRANPATKLGGPRGARHEIELLGQSDYAEAPISAERHELRRFSCSLLAPYKRDSGNRPEPAPAFDPLQDHYTGLPVEVSRMAAQKFSTRVTDDSNANLLKLLETWEFPVRVGNRAERARLGRSGAPDLAIRRTRRGRGWPRRPAPRRCRAAPSARRCSPPSPSRRTGCAPRPPRPPR